MTEKDLIQLIPKQCTEKSMALNHPKTDEKETSKISEIGS